MRARHQRRIGRLVAVGVLLLSFPATAEELEITPNLRLLTRISLEHRLPFTTVFEDGKAVVGSSEGLHLYGIHKEPPWVSLLGRLDCPSMYGEISVWRDFVFMSVENDVSPNDVKSRYCNNTDNSLGKEGLRIVDISDPAHPTQVKFLELECGSFSHTLVPSGNRLYIYDGFGCDAQIDLPTGGPSGLLEVIRFDRRRPQRTRVVARPHIGEQAGCMDITIFAPRALAVCVAFQQASLLDISDPVNPRLRATFLNPAGQPFWRGQFTWDGRYMVTVDGDSAMFGAPSPCGGPENQRGLMRVYDVRDPDTPTEVGRFALPEASVSPSDPCAPWDLMVLPTKARSRYIASVGWLEGGLRIIDFSDVTAPIEIGRLHPEKTRVKTGTWFNGRIYVADVATSTLTVLRLRRFGRENTRFFERRYNPQTQVEGFR